MKRKIAIMLVAAVVLVVMMFAMSPGVAVGLKLVPTDKGKSEEFGGGAKAKAGTPGGGAKAK